MGLYSSTHNSTLGVPDYSYVTERGRFYTVVNEMYELQSLPTDPVGVFNLTLFNVALGSTIHVSDQAGTTTRYSASDAGGTVLISLQTYSTGSPLNSLRIKVRKGSSFPYYQPWETQTTAVVGSQSIYVSQIPEE